MNIIHKGYFTVFECGKNVGELYAPFPYKAQLNGRDLNYIKKCINEFKQLALVDKLDMNKLMDSICNDVYQMKYSQGLVSNYQEYYI